MFIDEFTTQNIQNEAQNADCSFNFGPSLFKDSKEYLDDPFNFKLEYSLPDEARSYENKYEPNLSLDMTNSPSYYSCDNMQANKCTHDSNKAIDAIAAIVDESATVKETKIQPIEELKQSTGLNYTKVNAFGHGFYESKSSPNSSYSCDSAKLEQLIRCLTKSKGANVDKIDNDVVARTVELGQQRVDEDLNIPYRRYKSILNKVGIKTTAGRKVKNLQLETQLVNWSTQIKESKKLLTRKMIKDEAQSIISKLIEFGDLSLKKIRLSKGWLDKFVKRHPIISEYITSQKGKKGL
jgi:hypothetical protein